MKSRLFSLCVLSAFVSLTPLASAQFAPELPEWPVTKEKCDSGLSPVVGLSNTKGAVCQAIVKAGNTVLGRDPTVAEYQVFVPRDSRETSEAAWVNGWKGWIHSVSSRGQPIIHRAYKDAFGREATQAELTYWTNAKGGYLEMLNGNIAWVQGSAGASERTRIIGQGYKTSAFEREPTDAEVKYWMDQYGKAAAPAACKGGKVDTYDKLRCANNEWFWSGASLDERKRAVNAAGLLACFGPNNAKAPPGSKAGNTFEPPADYVDVWAKRILEDRLSVTSLSQSSKFLEKASGFCKSVGKAPAATKVVR